MSGALMQGPN